MRNLLADQLDTLAAHLTNQQSTSAQQFAETPRGSQSKMQRRRRCSPVFLFAGWAPDTGLHEHPCGGELVSMRAGESQQVSVVLVCVRVTSSPSLGCEGAHTIDGSAMAMSASRTPVSGADQRRGCLPLMPVVTAPAQVGQGVHVGIGEAEPATTRGDLLHISERKPLPWPIALSLDPTHSTPGAAE